ncbi:MAG TPA: hypothetical protein VFJ16_03355, partial [Longimicrobium sp.]|nr:hypothetical protein [Longimicrobium sp.]
MSAAETSGRPGVARRPKDPGARGGEARNGAPPGRAAFHNPVTGKLVEEFDPVRLWIYDPAPYPPALLNPLARALLSGDPRYHEGRYLFQRAGRPDDADLLLFPCDLNWFEEREEE